MPRFGREYTGRTSSGYSLSRQGPRIAPPYRFYRAHRYSTYRRPTLPTYWSYEYGRYSDRERASDRDLRLLRSGTRGSSDEEDGGGRRDDDKEDEAARLEKERKEKERLEREKEEREKEEREREEKEREKEKVIHLVSLDLHVQKNAERHHTDKFECTQRGEGERDPELVIRRGDNFLMSLTFNRPYNKDTDDLRLVFTSGDNPMPKHLNHASFMLDEDKSKNDGKDWSAVIQERKGSTLTLSVHVPANCVIGEWALRVKSILHDKDGGEAKIFLKTYDPCLTILLNPWCPEDKVYFSPEKGLDEYVLNDSGALFYGNYHQIGSRPWNFGQFEDGILDICVHLVRKAFGCNVDSNMADPVQIARGISKIVNDCDENGVLTGNWSGSYGGGVRPTAWAGSVKILKQYDKTGKPVKFGQCWVFSAITTTVCRALGLPCRSVTNFASAHDTDVSMTIDTVYELDREGIPEKTDQSADSVWNFHVWNEVWMKRDLLSPLYSGWQAVDATPQERSDGLYVCGPCPVEAIRQGDVTVLYDAPFIFAEVNADAIDWIRLADDPDEIYVMSVNKSKVGRKISTKRPTGDGFSGSLSVYGDDPEREDLTLTYKYAEGPKERAAVARAVATSSVKRPNYETPTPVQLSLEEKDQIGVGESFSYQAAVSNSHKSDSRTVTCSMVCTAIRYTGEKATTIKAQHFPTTTIKAGQKEVLSMNISPEDYLGKLPEGFAMEMQVFALVKEDRAYVSQSDDFRLRRPDLDISGPKAVKRKEEFKATVKLTNPLPVPLTKCKLSFEGGMEAVDGQSDIDCGTVPANSDWERTLELKAKPKPWLSIKRTISVSFDCEELPDISGFYSIILSK